jgi:hypothetical protein
MTTIRMAQPSDAKALLTLAQGFATSFVVDPQAFDIAFTELLAASSSYLTVAVRDCSAVALCANRHNSAGEVEPKGRSIAVPEIVGYVLALTTSPFMRTDG